MLTKHQSAGFSCINRYWFILSLRVKLIIARWKHIFIKPYIMSFCTNKEGNSLHKGIGRNVWTKQNDKLYSYNVKARNSRLRNQKHWQFQRQVVILELNDLSSNVCFFWFNRHNSVILCIYFILLDPQGQFEILLSLTDGRLSTLNLKSINFLWN